jgi:hypothetical protein
LHSDLVFLSPSFSMPSNSDTSGMSAPHISCKFREPFYNKPLDLPTARPIIHGHILKVYGESERSDPGSSGLR